MNTPKRKLSLWPGMIFALIGVNFCVVGVTVYAANFHHSSFSVEADYDTKALHWDETAKQNKRNTELGWTVRIDSTDQGKLKIDLSDKEGRPLDAATVKVEAFHHASAREKTVATLAPTGTGHYDAPATLTRPGLWEFRFTVNRGQDLFTQTLTRMILPPAPAEARS